MDFRVRHLGRESHPVRLGTLLAGVCSCFVCWSWRARRWPFRIGGLTCGEHASAVCSVCSVALACVGPAVGGAAEPRIIYEATRLSMACVYAIEAYGPDSRGIAVA